jgi:serine/threonine-protein kinase
MPLADGQVFAGYTILRRLGSGGMGEVYLAEHPRLPRRDALKVLSVELTEDPEYVERFNREADIVATLWHPHIVGVHDRGEVDGQLWISMDYVEGTDAARLLLERYPHGMPPDEVVRIVTAVAEALDYAHQRQLLHRDVKPANILLAQPDSGPEWVLLADFGVARWVQDASGLTGTSMTVGTVAYAAPEQLMGEAIDGRADQYALAATAFHLLTGSTLFRHSNPAVVISQHLSAPPPKVGDRRPELSGLGPVLSKALAKSPDDRYESCLDFARALQHGIGAVASDLGADDATIAAPAASRARRTKRGPGPRRTILAAAILAVLVIAGSAVTAIILGRQRHEASGGPPSAPAVPVVLLGADCATLGAAAQTTTGRQAYCARLPSTGDTMWSLYSSQVPAPVDTPGPTDEVYPPGIEEQVRVCVEESGQTRQRCRQDVRQGNLVGPP